MQLVEIKKILGENKYCTRLYSFTNRVVSWWNSLPEEVVMAPTVNGFKTRFDKHMKDHPVVYNYRALDHPLSPTMSVSWVSWIEEQAKLEWILLPDWKLYSTLLVQSLLKQEKSEVETCELLSVIFSASW